MPTIDPHLFHSFGSLSGGSGLEAMSFHQEEPVLPMLARLRNTARTESVLEGNEIQVTSRVGDIVSCLGTFAGLVSLQNNPDVLSIEVSRPTSGNDCAISVPFVRADAVHNDETSPEKGDHALVAIIDGGIDVLHEAFIDADRNTRIVALWDQTDPTGPSPVIPGCVSYGTLHSASQINGYLAKGKVPFGLGRDRNGHGTHVASIAAGRATEKFAGGIAPAAKMIAVISRLRVNPWDTFSIGYSSSHVDALAFIGQEAERLQLPVAVNVSQGMNAGAHDGTSCLESAFDNFSGGGRTPGRVIVKSAGNERNWAGHARFSVPNKSVEEVKILSTVDHSGPDVVELWFRSCDEFRFRLLNASSEASPWISAGRSIDGFFGSGVRYQQSYVRFHWDNGDSRVIITILPGRAPMISKGEWRIEIEALDVQSEGVIHAWLERDTTRPIRFTNHLSEDATLSIPATARTVIAVASVSHSIPVRVAPYSSFGPTRDNRQKPDLAAPGECIEAAKSGTADDVCFMSGTSMAAPHVTGAIALLLSSQEKRIRENPGAKMMQLNFAQIRAALCQSTQNYNDRHTSSMGYGVLDIRKLFDSIP